MTDPINLSPLNLPLPSRNRPGQAPSGPRALFRTETATSTSTLSSRNSLTTDSTASSPISLLPPSTASESHDVSAPPSPLSVSSPLNFTPPLTPKSSFSVKSVLKAPTITPPSPIKFDPVNIQWKSLPLEAALWTFDSQELQNIVSRAIRTSARESFVRLLSIHDLDLALPAELDRLDRLKETTQSKYRFLCHRRTMQLQALNSSSGAPSGDEGVPAISALTSQLCKTLAECDEMLEVLLQISNQQAQISKMLDVHWASALAIALRKLNKSYGRRAEELKDANSKTEQLEAELEDAWAEAEKMAHELDAIDLPVNSEDEDEAIISTAEIVPTTPMPSVFTLTRASYMNLNDPNMRDDSDQMTLNTLGTMKKKVGAEAVSLRSRRSRRSLKSSRSIKGSRMGDPSRSEIVSSAKYRSQLASKNSLRIPRRPIPSFSNSTSPKTVPQDIGEPQEIQPQDVREPQVPNITMDFAFASVSSQTHHPRPSSSFIHHSPEASAATSARRRRTSIDDIDVVAKSVISVRTHVTVDDIGVRPHHMFEAIQDVPRNPFSSADDINITNRVGSGSPAEPIPSIWLHADTPKTPAERAESLTKVNSYRKLKTLTKRYSLLPLFQHKSASARLSPLKNGS